MLSLTEGNVTKTGGAGTLLADIATESLISWPVCCEVSPDRWILICNLVRRYTPTTHLQLQFGETGSAAGSGEAEYSS